jgi:hypothetical protein
MSARRKFALTLPVKQFFNRKPANFTTILYHCPGVILGITQATMGGSFEPPVVGCNIF